MDREGLGTSGTRKVSLLCLLSGWVKVTVASVRLLNPGTAGSVGYREGEGHFSDQFGAQRQASQSRFSR